MDADEMAELNEMKNMCEMLEKDAETFFKSNVEKVNSPVYLRVAQDIRRHKRHITGLIENYEEIRNSVGIKQVRIANHANKQLMLETRRLFMPTYP